MNADPGRRVPFIPGLVILLVRGVALWFVIPIGALCWMVASPVMRRRGVGLGQLLGWLDLNLIALIERGLLKPLIRMPSAWTPIAELPNVTHRVRLFDPA